MTSSKQSHTSGVSSSTSCLAALIVIVIPFCSSLLKINGLNSSNAIFLGRPHWCSLSVGPETTTDLPE